MQDESENLYPEFGYVTTPGSAENVEFPLQISLELQTFCLIISVCDDVPFTGECLSVVMKQKSYRHMLLFSSNFCRVRN